MSRTIVVLALVCLLSACGGEADSTANTPEPAPEDPAGAGPAAATAGDPHRGTRPFAGTADAQVRLAEALMAALQTAVENYHLVHGRLPKTLAILAEHDEKAGAPFIDSGLDDPWGNAFTMEALDASHVVIRSAGPDGEAGTDDDLRWPKE